MFSCIVPRPPAASAPLSLPSSATCTAPHSLRFIAGAPVSASALLRPPRHASFWCAASADEPKEASSSSAAPARAPAAPPTRYGAGRKTRYDQAREASGLDSETFDRYEDELKDPVIFIEWLVPRPVRLFLYAGIGGNALLGAFIQGTGVLARSSRGEALGEELLANLGLNLAGAAGMAAAFLLDRWLGERRRARRARIREIQARPRPRPPRPPSHPRLRSGYEPSGRGRGRRCGRRGRRRSGRGGGGGPGGPAAGGAKRTRRSGCCEGSLAWGRRALPPSPAPPAPPRLRGGQVPIVGEAKARVLRELVAALPPGARVVEARTRPARPLPRPNCGADCPGGARAGGTFLGYSAISMAQALPPGAEVVTYEKDVRFGLPAMRFVQQAGMGGRVDVKLGDAVSRIPSDAAAWRRSERGAVIDLLFLDGAPGEYEAYLEAARPYLRPASVVVADNTGIFGEQLAGYLAAVRDPARFASESIEAPLANYPDTIDAMEKSVLL
eukprot:tig00021796_g23547.t2